MLALLSRIDALEFVDKVIDNNFESDGSGGKLWSSMISKENNGGIGVGWAKEKGGGTTTARTAMARKNNNGAGDKNSVRGGGALNLGKLFGRMKKTKGSWQEEWKGSSNTLLARMTMRMSRIPS
jgi:hypothetical protein